MLLVTGAAGYIGSHFVRHYLAENAGAAVVAVDNLSLGHRQALSSDDKVVFYQTELADRDALTEIMVKHKVSAVVHFAARAYVGESQQRPFFYLDNNVGGTTSLLAAMHAAGVEKLVFSSTCSSYGNPVYSPIDEKHPQNPINTYGTSKLMVEQMLAALALCTPLRYIVLRYFNAAGADDSGQIGESHDPETHLLPLAIQAALGKTPQLKVFGNDYDTPDGTCVRDYIHVNDLASAHLLALSLLDKEKVSLAVNLGTAKGASVKEIINMVESVSGAKVPHEFVERRPGDPSYLVSDNSKAKEVLGWTPKYDLRRTVETAVNWERNRLY